MHFIGLSKTSAQGTLMSFINPLSVENHDSKALRIASGSVSAWFSKRVKLKSAVNTRSLEYLMDWLLFPSSLL